MAIRIAAANDGNLTAAATWHLCDATSALDVETGTEELGTAYASSAVFAPGIIEVDGVAIKIASTLASPTGTISVQLYNSTDSIAVAGTEVTINASDIASATTGNIGWVFFKFGSPVTLEAAHNYTVQAKESAAADNVVVYQNGTAANYSMLLRTTTDGAPAAGDKMLILGEWTAAATKTDINVVMDCTATTDFGTASTTIESLGIGKGGTLTWGTAAATAYNFRLSGLLKVWNGGTYNQGTVATPIPSGSTAKLEFDCAADGDFGFYALGGTVVMQGIPRTADRCLLNTNEAAGQTVLGVDTDTDWVSGDVIAIAPTNQTRAQWDLRTVSSSDATTVTVTVGLTYAHSGTSPTQAEVMLLTRNVKVCSASASNRTFVSICTGSTVDIDWAEFYYLGENATGKRGIDISSTSGSCSIQRCSVYTTEDYGLYFTGSINLTFSYNVMYNCSIAGSDYTAMTISAAAGSGSVISYNIAHAVATYNLCCRLTTYNLTFTNNTFIGGDYGLHMNAASATTGTISNITCHSNNSAGFYITTSAPTLMSYLTAWRNLYYGVSTTGTGEDWVLDNVVAFGNGECNVLCDSNGYVQFTITNSTFNGDASFATSYGISTRKASLFLLIQNCSFGQTTAHVTADIWNTGSFLVVEAYNSSFNTTLTKIFVTTATSSVTYFASSKHQTSAGNYLTIVPYGRLSRDTVIFNTATPSLKMVPTSASYKLESANYSHGAKIAVASGNTLTPAVYVRKSVVGDAGGANYNGNQPRLIVKANPELGIAADAVLDTMTVAIGNWEQLTGTTAAVSADGALEFVVDCDGTAGWVNVDDWSVS